MQITTEFVTFVFIVLGAVAGAWWRVELAIRTARDEVKRDAAEAKTAASAASGQAILFAQQLAEYKTHVAETYITKAGVREFRDEVMTGVRDLKGSISTLHGRIDAMILAESRDRIAVPHG